MDAAGWNQMDALLSRQCQQEWAAACGGDTHTFIRGCVMMMMMQRRLGDSDSEKVVWGAF